MAGLKRKRTIISKAPLQRILLDVGAKRVSDESLEIFSEILIEYAFKISVKAIAYAEHGKRKTVTDKDIKLAREEGV